MRLVLSWSLALAFCVTLARGVPVEKWVQTTRADFEKGEAKGASILALGQLALAPELKPLLKATVPHVWALATDAQGTIYAATGTQPKVLRIRDGKADDFFTSPDKGDLEILAVAVAPDGAAYASAAPSGTLYRITPDGKADVLYKSPDPYIWAIAIAPDGSGRGTSAVYAGTGPNGKLLKITGKDKAATVLTANAQHILSLALAPDGTLYAGTDKEGLLYAVNPKGEARVAYDAEESDIRALALGPDGRLYFATAATSGGPPASAAAPTTPSARMLTLISQGQPAEGPTAQPSRPSPSKPAAPGAKVSATNSVYQLAPNGDVLKLASVEGVVCYALQWHKGSLFVASGNDGGLYRIEKDTAVLLANLDESQITSLAVAKGRLVLGTSNSGQVFEVAADHAAAGTFLSEVHDSNGLSHWGSIAWEATTPEATAVTLATRSGNTAKPDSTWSAWSPEYARPAGQPVASPLARFIQYRATFQTKRPDVTPVLDEVSIAYVQTNRAPEVTKVALTTPPKARRVTPPPPQMPGQPMAMMPNMGMPQARNKKRQAEPSPRGPHAETIRITWQASDPNKDELTYSIYFRGTDETTWKKLDERITQIYYDWDTDAVPDGSYRIRVVASDEPTNPPDQALQGEEITEPFIIDNTPPAVTGLAARINNDRTVTVTARASDAGCGLDEGEYSIDAGDWITIVPTDGIFDSNAEAIDFKTAPLAKGEHTIVVRVRDEAENSGAAKSVVTIE